VTKPVVSITFSFSFRLIVVTAFDVMPTSQWRSRADKLSRATFAHAIVATGGRPHRGDTPGAEVCLTSGTTVVRIEWFCLLKAADECGCHTIFISLSLRRPEARVGSSAMSDWFFSK
jgi:hypothetical protein